MAGTVASFFVRCVDALEPLQAYFVQLRIEPSQFLFCPLDLLNRRKLFISFWSAADGWSRRSFYFVKAAD
jgi:hypothetical protein